MIELLGREPNCGGKRSIKCLPNEVAQPDGEPRRMNLARCRHLDALACVEQQAEYAADRLDESAGGILRSRARVREAAVPGRGAAHRARGKAVDDLHRGE